jgi:hypothetical protein
MAWFENPLTFLAVVFLAFLTIFLFLEIYKMGKR